MQNTPSCRDSMANAEWVSAPDVPCRPASMHPKKIFTRPRILTTPISTSSSVSFQLRIRSVSKCLWKNGSNSVKPFTNEKKQPEYTHRKYLEFPDFERWSERLLSKNFGFIIIIIIIFLISIIILSASVTAVANSFAALANTRAPAFCQSSIIPLVSSSYTYFSAWHIKHTAIAMSWVSVYRTCLLCNTRV